MAICARSNARLARNASGPPPWSRAAAVRLPVGGGSGGAQNMEIVMTAWRESAVEIPICAGGCPPLWPSPSQPPHETSAPGRRRETLGGVEGARRVPSYIRSRTAGTGLSFHSHPKCTTRDASS